MDNDSGYRGVGLGDAGVLALLTDTARAGNRGGGGGFGIGGEGGGFLGAPFAGFASNAVRTECNNDLLTRNAIDGQFRESRHDLRHLGDRLAECCCENRVANAEIKGVLSGLQTQINDIPTKVQICVDQQTIANLNSRIAEMQSNSHHHHRGGGD